MTKGDVIAGIKDGTMQCNRIAGHSTDEIVFGSWVEYSVKNTMKMVQDISQTCSRENKDAIIEIHRHLAMVTEILEKFEM